MPRYEYCCTVCNTTVEHHYSHPDAAPPQMTCPVCREKSAERVFSGGQYAFVKGDSKNSGPKNTYAAGDRPMMSMAGFRNGLSANQYEHLHDRVFAAGEKMAREVDRNRRQAGRADSEEVRWVGSVPVGEFLAREKQGGEGSAFDVDHWKHQGRIFDHEKDRVSEDKDE